MKKSIKYRKKATVVDAIQFDGFAKGGNDLPQNVALFFGKKSGIVATNEGGKLYLYTAEGMLRVSAGDYIVRSETGEFQAMNPDVFKATYEAA